MDKLSAFLTHQNDLLPFSQTKTNKVEFTPGAIAIYPKIEKQSWGRQTQKTITIFTTAHNGAIFIMINKLDEWLLPYTKGY